MVVENIIVRIKSVAEIKALANTVQQLKQLKRTGVDVSKPMARANKRMGQLHVTTKKAGIAFKGFQMEMLSVLFFGMAMSKFLTSLIKPAFDLTGTFEILNLMLGAAFLPTAEKVNESLFGMLENFLTLDEDTRELIGDMILLAAGIFTAWMMFGIFALGLQGIGTLFGLTSPEVLIFAGAIITIIAAIIWLNKLFKEWEKTSDLVKAATVALELIIAGIAVALGADLVAAIMLVIAATTLLRMHFDILRDYAEKNPILGPWIQEIKDFIEEIKKLIDVYKRIKAIVTGKAAPYEYGGFTPVPGGFTPVPTTSTIGPTTTIGDINVSATFAGAGINMAEITGQIDELAKQIGEQIATELDATIRR